MKIFSITISILLITQGLYSRNSPTLSCKVPFSPSTPSQPKIGRNGKFQGNCRVKGDRGWATCHAPNEAHKSLSILKKRVKYDSLFLKTQRKTGVSWKLLKSFVYQETSLIDRYMRIDRITSGDGKGTGFLQLTVSAIRHELKKYNKGLYSIYNVRLTKTSVKQNSLHHMMLGASWLLHKMKMRGKWGNSKFKTYFSKVFHTYKDTQEGWGIKEVKHDVKMYKIVKEGITAFNGLSRGCIVNGRVLTAYADHIEHYYNALMGISPSPIPYVESVNESEEIALDDTVISDNIIGNNPRSIRKNYGKKKRKNHSSKRGIGIRIGIGI